MVDKRVLGLHRSVRGTRLVDLLHQLAHDLPTVVHCNEQRARVEQLHAAIGTFQYVGTSQTRSARVERSQHFEVVSKEQLEQRASDKVELDRVVRAIVRLEWTFAYRVFAFNVTRLFVAVQSKQIQQKLDELVLGVDFGTRFQYGQSGGRVW